MAMIQINEEQLQDIIQREVSKIVLAKENYINTCICNTILSEIKNQVVIHNKIEKYLDKSFVNEDSPVVGVIKHRVSKAVELYLIDKRNTFNNKVLGSIQTSVSDFVNSPQIVKGLIEPWLTKHITESSEFVTYVQSKIEHRLSNKITSLNNILGENITMPIVKEFLTDYLTRRNMKGDIS